jgi:hypothetical protein
MGLLSPIRFGPLRILSKRRIYEMQVVAGFIAGRLPVLANKPGTRPARPPRQYFENPAGGESTRSLCKG